MDALLPNGSSPNAPTGVAGGPAPATAPAPAGGAGSGSFGLPMTIAGGFLRLPMDGLPRSFGKLFGTLATP